MLQRTLAIVKPDAFPQHVGAILTMATEAGLIPVRMKMEEYLDETWQNFYAEHKERHFFKALVEFMQSGPVLVMVFEGDYAITHWRELMGPTDSRKARLDSVRGRFGAKQTNPNRCIGLSSPTGKHALGDGIACTFCLKSVEEIKRNAENYPMWRNAVHGSDSVEAAAREIEFFFGFRA